MDLWRTTDIRDVGESCECGCTSKPDDVCGQGSSLKVWFRWVDSKDTLEEDVAQSTEQD